MRLMTLQKLMWGLLLLAFVSAPVRGDLIVASPLSTSPEEFSTNGRKWAPGPNTAAFLTFPSPGGATFSIMGAGIGLDPGSNADTDHTGTTSSILDLNISGFTTAAHYAAVIDWALNSWAAVSGFTNLGEVADSGALMGAPDASGGHIGDIRVAAWEITTSTVLAHAFVPGNEPLNGPGASIRGDVHFDVGRTWVDNPGDISGNGEYDIYTVALHEIGHSLGLSHSAVSGSVMYAAYSGAKRTLTADDIAGIQAIYGPPPPSGIPEPSTIC
ncbi:MAG: matrixin family metalloprotease [Planctomycetota bacterium]|nr:matrixin family metalloprotease [Planctomycetota bacterium]